MNKQEELWKELEKEIKDIKNRIPIDSPEFEQAEEQIEPMLELSKTLVNDIAKFKPLQKGEKGWQSLILLALGRTTSILLNALDHIHATTIPAMDLYVNLILPLCEASTHDSEADIVINIQETNDLN